VDNYAAVVCSDCVVAGDSLQEIDYIYPLKRLCYNRLKLTNLVERSQQRNEMILS